MRLFAHRGCPAQGPENTVAAVERAAPHVDIVEIDVRRCGSGELVVFHDSFLFRLLSHPDGRPAAGRLRSTNWSRLRRLRVAGTDHVVPRFVEMVAAVDAAGLDLNVELKESGLTADVADVLDGFDGDVIVSSSSAAVLREMRAVADLPLAPIVDAGWLTRRATAWRRGLELAADLDAVAIHPAYDLLLSASDPRSRVNAAHEVGVAVHAWTVADSTPVRALVRAGVDGLMVDDWRVVMDADVDRTVRRVTGSRRRRS